MPLHEQQRFEILDRLAHEGETQLLFAPLEKPPLDLPPGWSELLTCRDPGPAALQLWGKMRPRLPRIARAFEHRLHGLALLRTEDVPASLVYIFKSGQEVFAYRGSPPVSTPPDAPELRDFYSVHDGWVSLFTEDDGPMPTTAWNVLRKPLWPETQWRVHPGAGSLENFAAIYVDEDEVVFAIDTSKPLTQPLICRPNGTVEPMADLWDAIDREVGEFLLELDPAVLAPPPSEAFVFPPSDQALQHVAERWSEAARLGGGYYQKQWCLMLLDRAAFQEGSPRAVTLREALSHFCQSLELGTESDPTEILEFFSLAHSIREAAAVRFLSSVPQELWGDGTIEAVQLAALLSLYKRNLEVAGLLAEEAAGLMAAQPSLPAETVTFQRGLEDLIRGDEIAFRHSRAALEDSLRGLPQPIWTALPAVLRAQALDAVSASR